jgi:hypothetical protein
MKIRLSSDFVLAHVSLAGLLVIQLGHAEEMPRKEFGCEVRDAQGMPLNSADQTSQQRIEAIRCMDATSSEARRQSALQKSQQQSVENLRNARRAQAEMTRPGYGRPPSFNWRPPQ